MNESRAYPGLTDEVTPLAASPVLDPEVRRCLDRGQQLGLDLVHRVLQLVRDGVLCVLKLKQKLSVCQAGAFVVQTLPKGHDFGVWDTGTVHHATHGGRQYVVRTTSRPLSPTVTMTKLWVRGADETFGLLQYTIHKHGKVPVPSQVQAFDDLFRSGMSVWHDPMKMGDVLLNLFDTGFFGMPLFRLGTAIQSGKVKPEAARVIFARIQKYGRMHPRMIDSYVKDLVT